MGAACSWPNPNKALAPLARKPNQHRRSKESVVHVEPPETPAVIGPTRLSIWVQTAGARGMAMRQREKPYEELARVAAQEGALPPGADIAITNDVPRTFFAGHSPPSPEEAETLQRLLRALAILDPELAYCQGMNFIVAFAILSSGWGGHKGGNGKPLGSASLTADVNVGCPHDNVEVDAFWLVVCLLEYYGARGLFLQNTPLLKLYSYCLSRLLERRLPQVHSLLGGLDAILGFKWFGTLFTTVLPPEAALRAWDLLLHDGLNALLCLALGLCSLMAPALQAAAEEGEEPCDVLGRLQRQLPLDASLLLPPGNMPRQPAANTGKARMPAMQEPNRTMGEHLLVAASNFACNPQELEELLLEWRREHPKDAPDLEFFSFFTISL